MNVGWDELGEVLNRPEVERFKEIVKSSGWDYDVEWDGIYLIKKNEEVNESVTMTIGCDQMIHRIPLDEILLESAKTFHIVAAACEMALSTKSQNNVYLYEEVEAMKRLLNYIDIAAGMKQDMIDLTRKVRGAKIDLYAV